jgi:hypothetical protein
MLVAQTVTPMLIVSRIEKNAGFPRLTHPFVARRIFDGAESPKFSVSQDSMTFVPHKREGADSARNVYGRSFAKLISA